MAPQSCSIGSAAPDFDVEVVDANGTVVEKQLSALRPEGRALVLDFFAPWCKSCPAAAKKLDELAGGEYGSQCVFVLVCVDGGIDGAKEFAAAHGIQKCVIAAVVDDDDPSDLYAVKGLPHHTLIDCQGVLVKNYSVELPGDLDACLQAKPEATQSGYPQSIPENKESVLPVDSVSQEFVERELSDPLLMDNPSRWVMFPIQYPEVWEAYKKHEASFWTAEEIDIQQDKKDFEKLSDSEQHFVKHVLASFAASDGSVLASQFSTEVQIPEARAFYGFQIAMEFIHSETYSSSIEQYIKDQAEQVKICNAIETMPAVRKKAQWFIQKMHKENSFAERIMAYAAIEGILCSGSFCAIYWLKKRGLMPGLTFSNELISRDKGMHAEFACLLYGLLQNKLPDSVAHDLVRGAVEIEQEFICEAISCDLIGVDKQLMARYIECVADGLLTALGHPKIYNASNPFDWMQLITLQGRSNFSKGRVGESAHKEEKKSPTEEQQEPMGFALDIDF